MASFPGTNIIDLTQEEDPNVTLGPARTVDFFSELFGPNTAVTPVFGSQHTLKLLEHALEAGLSVSSTPPPNGVPVSTWVMDATVNWLQRGGKVPVDFREVANLSDEQRAASGFEPSTVAVNPEMSVQAFGVPPFKEVDMDKFLACLRFVARFQEIKTASKPVFQVGVVTRTVDGTHLEFFAQTLAAELGLVTDTVWLYRNVVMGPGGQYEENWNSFDGPAIPRPTAPVDQAQALQPPTFNSNDSGIGSSSSSASSPSSKASTGRINSRKPWQRFDHTAYTDAELFATSPGNLHGPTILRLARDYSNQEIFIKINEARGPGRGVNSVNVITKRITFAVAALAEESGRSVEQIREELADAKTAKGVKHKGKVDTKPYTSKAN